MHPAELAEGAAAQPLAERRLHLARIVLLRQSAVWAEQGRAKDAWVAMELLRHLTDANLDEVYAEIGGDTGGGPLLDITQQIDWDVHALESSNFDQP